MEPKEIHAELSIKMLELEKALDTGMPYPGLRTIYSEIKELQYQLALVDAERPMAKTESGDSEVVLE